MKDLIEKTTESISASVTLPANEYIDEEGLARCSVCHERVEYIARVPELNLEKKVRCICSCIQKERDAHKEFERQQDIFRERIKCFEESNMIDWTFENDDGGNPKMILAMKNYVAHFPKFRDEGKGLLLYGAVGTGKTYLAACIANALIEVGYTAKMTNFSRVANALFNMKENKNVYLDSLNKCSLLILDDLGTERNTEYMQEQVFNIIDARYRSGLPFIVTTNLSASELKKTDDIKLSRIYDRILERCHPVKVEGASRRRNKLRETFSETNELLGL